MNRLLFLIVPIMLIGSLNPAEKPVSAELLPVNQNGRWGYIDRSGKLVIACQFVEAGYFSEGLAAVGVQNPDEPYALEGYIDNSGGWRIKPQFDWAGAFHEGFARVHLEDQHLSKALVSSNGDIVAVPNGSGNAMVLRDVFNGRAAFSPDGNQFGFIDAHGTIIVPAQFDTVGDFTEGYAVVTTRGKSGYINAQGTLVVPQVYALAGAFHGGRAAVCRKPETSCGYVDPSGNFTPSQHTIAFRTWPFSNPEILNHNADGLHLFYDSGKYGYVNDDGKIVISPAKYWQAREFSEGLAAVTKNEYGSCGYIDRSGRLAIPTIYVDCEDFHDGYAGVSVDDKNIGRSMGYIDKSGKFIWLSNSEPLH